MSQKLPVKGKGWVHATNGQKNKPLGLGGLGGLEIDNCAIPRVSCTQLSLVQQPLSFANLP